MVDGDERLVQVKSQCSGDRCSYSEAWSETWSCGITDCIWRGSISNALEGFLYYTACNFVVMLCGLSRMYSYPRRWPVGGVIICDYTIRIVDHTSTTAMIFRLYS